MSTTVAALDGKTLIYGLSAFEKVVDGATT